MKSHWTSSSRAFKTDDIISRANDRGKYEALEKKIKQILFSENFIKLKA